MAKKTVVVGMSGGVDSSVAAALLLEEGYEVIGLFMHNWEEQEDGECTSAADFADAVAVCATLDMPCYSVNFSEEYMQRVFSYFLEEYRRGRTPNPDVLCNREIKFGPFKDYAKQMGADFVATGHYCGIEECFTGNMLVKAADGDKDQTYFLNQVTSAQLEDVLFPLHKLKKGEVRNIAAQRGLSTAKKKDSTGICFIGERKFKQFLERYLPAQKGEIRDINGKVLGTHSGLMYYTLGQRRGLGIGGVKGEDGGRWYVAFKDLVSNTLVVSCGQGEELLSDGLVTEGFNFIGGEIEGGSFECTAKFRYRQAEQQVKASKLEGGCLKIDFANPQRAVTPGQYAVLYMGERCLGGGVIGKTFSKDS